ncbi:MAG: extracellular solute-binding protein [Blautia sp.]|nr:extracellular solute-binding protein [Blautia sp.]
MKKILLPVLAALLLFLSSSTLAEEIRPVLTIGDTLDRSGARVNGADQLGIWRYLEDQIGMEIQYVYVSQEEYTSMMNSGNLPDILITNNNLFEIREKGLALNIAPYLEEYAPNLLKGDVGLACQVIRQINHDEDGFWFIPEKIGINGAGYHNQAYNRGFVVRWDYYKELGYPPINNEDDYLRVLKQMYANHPYTEEGYPTYLFGIDNHTGYATAFRAEVSLDYWGAFKYQNNIFTNEIYDGYTDPEHSMWWTSMAWYNKLYHAGKEDGSFDIESFYQTITQHDAKCARGQYLGLHNGKTTFYEASVRKDPDTLAGYGTVPSAGTNYYTNVNQLLGNGSAFMWFISANTQHKEAALKLINFMADLDFLRDAAVGQKGVTWDYDENGVPRMNEYGQAQLDEYMQGSPSPDNYYVQWGVFSGLTDRWPMLLKLAKHPDGYPLDFVTTTREYMIDNMTNNISKDICAHYGVELPTDAHYNLGAMDFRNDCGEAITSSLSSLSRDQLQILKEADAIMESTWRDMCVAETEEEFLRIRDETIQKVIATGEPEVFREYQKMWDAAAAIIVPLSQQVQRDRGVEPYGPEDYESRFTGNTEEKQP